MEGQGGKVRCPRSNRNRRREVDLGLQLPHPSRVSQALNLGAQTEMQARGLLRWKEEGSPLAALKFILLPQQAVVPLLC